MKLSRKFGAVVREIRTSRNITQQELSLRCGLSVDAISEIERGLRLPRLDSIKLLAIGLEIRPGVLVDRACV